MSVEKYSCKTWLIESNFHSAQGTEFYFISSKTNSNEIKETLIKYFPEYEKSLRNLDLNK